ncbi:hypothetical protein GW755_00335 [bacterium]|nr:hypothetical protein [bacterium]
MNLLSRKSFRKITAVVLFVILGNIPLLSLHPNLVSSVSLASYSDTMSRQKISTDSSHTFVLTLGATTALDAAETVEFTFAPEFTIADSTDATTDYTFNDGTARTITDVTGSCSAGANNVSVLANDTAKTITFTACSGFTSSAAGATITIEIGIAAGGVDIITNPAVTNTYDIGVVAATETGNLSQVILNDDQVQITASVNPSLTVSLSSNTCALGDLTTAQVDSCNYNINVDTNSTNGYTATITEDGNLRTGAGDDINDETGSETLVAGTEEYGVGSSDSDVAGGSNEFPTYTDCGDPVITPVAGAITASPAKVVGKNASSGTESITVCHMATIGSGTATGSYSHLVTIIVTALY